MNAKIKIKPEPNLLETASSTGLSESKGSHGSHVYIKEESTSDILFQSEGDIQVQDNEIEIKTEIKEEPIILETTSNEMKIQSKVNHGSYAYIKNESSSLYSEIIFQSDCELYRSNNEKDSKIEIKEEAVYMEETFLKLKSEIKEINLENVELHSNTEDKAWEECQELAESSRLDKQAAWNSDPGIIHAGLNKNCLELRENNSPCHEKSNSTTAHGVNITEVFTADGKTSHKCKFCGKCFKIHIVNHEGESKLKSNVCDNNITEASHLEELNLIHEDKRLFKCDKCDKSYPTAVLLRAHNLFHEVRKLYNCDECEENFITELDLKSHNLVHKKKPYTCFQCEESFTTELDLKDHNFVHENSHLHKCHICEKSFTSASYLKRHILVHEGKSPYKCKICRKNFTARSSLKAHSFVHEGSRMHKCHLCKMSIAKAFFKDHLLAHVGKTPYK